MKGDGHAILQAKNWIDSKHLAILYGDDLIAGEKNGLQQLVSAFDDLEGETGEAAMLCLQDIDQKLVHKYGIVEIAPDKHQNRTKKIVGLVEKPKPEDAPSTLAIVGKYIVPRSTIEELDRVESGHHDKEIRLIDALKSQMETIQIYGHEFEGVRLDTGTPEGYKEAVRVLG